MKKNEKHTEETKRLISKNRKGKATGINHPMYGKHHTDESKKKNRLAHLGKKMNLKTRMKISMALKGKQPKNIVAGWNRGIKTGNIPKTAFKLGDKRIVGKNNPNWKGGISKLNKTKRQLEMETSRYKNWRKFVFERDGYTCQICEEAGKRLRANHIKRYVDYKELRTEKNNGITICENCDVKWVLHREKDWENYFNFNLKTREVYIDDYERSTVWP